MKRLALAAVLALVAVPASAGCWLSPKDICEAAEFRAQATEWLRGEKERTELAEYRATAPARHREASAVLAEQAAWVERCKPRVVVGADGTPRREYAAPNCAR